METPKNDVANYGMLFCGRLGVARINTKRLLGLCRYVARINTKHLFGRCWDVVWMLQVATRFCSLLFAPEMINIQKKIPTSLPFLFCADMAKFALVLVAATAG